MEFLPYHYLLATVGNAGYLKYQDTSTGELVAMHRTGLGKCDAMTQNPRNAIIHLGHSNGTVTLWSPNMSKAHVSLFCHRGRVNSLAVDRSGTYMATAGMDGLVKIYDLRTLKPLNSYFSSTPARSLAISQRDMLAVGFGPHVQIWKDALAQKARSPYLKHSINGHVVQNLAFCPYEDVLGIGSSKGFSSIIAPGAGEPNFDSFEANPYETSKQRTEKEVRTLLEKIQPDMITMDDSFIGQMDQAPQEVLAKERQLVKEANQANRKKKEKKKQRGKNRRFKRKQDNVITIEREKAKKAREEYLRKKRERKEQQEREARGESSSSSSKTKEIQVLNRFKTKGR
eukprot:TRINITY_DN32196_c0_g1_i1.p1 TRINITY_DN32196_c0_g1~~TRINITY_DN32196_c0_g1_i1.p1  ORF type:complete len:391 (-),score=127.92 TRINITY_DN32196_c0_g1_i1:674-1699(-)